MVVCTRPECQTTAGCRCHNKLYDHKSKRSRNSDLEADNASLREQVERLTSERDEALKTLDARAQCPFDYIDCELEPEEPCPVCGSLGTLDAEIKCPFPAGGSNTALTLVRATAAEAQLAEQKAENERLRASCISAWAVTDDDDKISAMAIWPDRIDASAAADALGMDQDHVVPVEIRRALKSTDDGRA